MDNGTDRHDNESCQYGFLRNLVSCWLSVKEAADGIKFLVTVSISESTGFWLELIEIFYRMGDGLSSVF